jgi:hypothetical protein
MRAASGDAHSPFEVEVRKRIDDEQITTLCKELKLDPARPEAWETLARLIRWV